MAAFIPRSLWTLVALGALVVFGTTGYMVLEEQGFADSLYMTVITLTAVGYQEVWPLTPQDAASRYSSCWEASAGSDSGSLSSPHSSSSWT